MHFYPYKENYNFLNIGTHLVYSMDGNTGRIFDMKFVYKRSEILFGVVGV